MGHRSNIPEEYIDLEGLHQSLVDMNEVLGRHWVSAHGSMMRPIARWYTIDSEDSRSLEIHNALMSFHQFIRSSRITLLSFSCSLSSEVNIEILLGLKYATFGVRTWVFSLLVATWVNRLHVCRKVSPSCHCSSLVPGVLRLTVSLVISYSLPLRTHCRFLQCWRDQLVIFDYTVLETDSLERQTTIPQTLALLVRYLS